MNVIPIRTLMVYLIFQADAPQKPLESRLFYFCWQCKLFSRIYFIFEASANFGGSIILFLV